MYKSIITKSHRPNSYLSKGTTKWMKILYHAFFFGNNTFFHGSFAWLHAVTCMCCRWGSGISVFSTALNLLLPGWHILWFFSDTIKKLALFQRRSLKTPFIHSYSGGLSICAVTWWCICTFRRTCNDCLYISTCAWLAGTQVLLVKASWHNSCETFNVPHGRKCWQIQPIKTYKKIMMLNDLKWLTIWQGCILVLYIYASWLKAGKMVH